MSQIQGKIVQVLHFSTDLRIILTRQTFTPFFKSRSKKIATYMFKTRGAGVKGRLNNVIKNCTFGEGWLPLIKYPMM